MTPGQFVALGLAVAGLLPFGARAELIFSCSLGPKSVSVVRKGENWIYRFGRPGRAELTIVGSPAKNNVFLGRYRYFSDEEQLRFTNGSYSYIVFDLSPRPDLGAVGGAGLIVLSGMRTVASMNCTKPAYFHLPLDSGLPLDGTDYGAMGL